jgi:hypothetical protein
MGRHYLTEIIIQYNIKWAIEKQYRKEDYMNETTLIRVNVVVYVLLVASIAGLIYAGQTDTLTRQGAIIFSIAWSSLFTALQGYNFLCGHPDARKGIARFFRRVFSPASS